MGSCPRQMLINNYSIIFIVKLKVNVILIVILIAVLLLVLLLVLVCQLNILK